jgi:hypothetical protein
MPPVTLLARIYSNSQQRLVDRFLKTTLQGLRLESKIVGNTSRGWVQMSISGEDEHAASRYLADRIGLCPMYMEKVEKFATLKGRVTDLSESKDALRIDIGIFSPNIVDAAIPLSRVQAQLADGRKIALRKCTELFGFCDNLPLDVKICNVNSEKNWIEAMLSERQLSQHMAWIDSLLDRLTVLGASEHEIELALKTTGSNRDVVSIEPLGLFEYAVTCKLGTDAAGLIPRIGRKLRNATLSVFSPRRIRGFFGDFSTYKGETSDQSRMR